MKKTNKILKNFFNTIKFYVLSKINKLILIKFENFLQHKITINQMNPLLQKFNTKHNSAPFNEIKEEHYLPAFKELIEKSKVIVMFG